MLRYDQPIKQPSKGDHQQTHKRVHREVYKLRILTPVAKHFLVEIIHTQSLSHLHIFVLELHTEKLLLSIGATITVNIKLVHFLHSLGLKSFYSFPSPLKLYRSNNVYDGIRVIYVGKGGGSVDFKGKKLHIK